MITGPNIIRDGLVFGYDADDRSTRFYKGEPTTNLLTNPLMTNLSSWFVAQYPSGTYDPTDGIIWDQDKIKVKKVGGYSNTQTFLGQSQTLVIGKTYTASVLCKTTGTGAVLDIYTGGGWVAQFCNNLNNEWVKLTVTFTVVSTTSCQVRCGIYSTGNGVAYFKEFQLEEKNHNTQFVNGTRTSTQSLIDLKRKTNIDISNLSFDWKGNPYFYNSGILLGSIFNLNDYFVNNGSFTIETYIRIDLVRNRGAVFNNQRYSAEADPGGFGLVIENSPPKFGLNLTNSAPSSYENLAGIPIQKAKYQHIVYVYEPGVVKSYLNGVLYATATNSSYSWSIASDSIRTYIGVGTQGGWGYVNGMDIKTLKVYNKPLTQKDVEQNYNAVKSRFNIENELNSGLVLNLDAGNKNSLISGGTTWYDLAGINNGTLINGPTFNNMFESLSFDGINDYCLIPHNTTLNFTSISVLMWVKTPSSYSSRFRGIIGKFGADRDFNFYAYSSLGNGVIDKFHLSTSRLTSYLGVVDIPGGSLSLNRWHQVGFIIGNGYISYILNGVIIANGSYSGTFNANSGYDLIVGSADNYWLGDVATSKIWNRLLSSTEISQLFEMERGRFGI